MWKAEIHRTLNVFKRFQAFSQCHYLAAFTACILNNQPMGFYSPATLVKDAQRHGQHFRSVDIQHSKHRCTIEKKKNVRYVRLGFNYVKGLGAATAQAIVEARDQKDFTSIHDLVQRVPQLTQLDLVRLSELGALNGLPQQEQDRHRRGALWHATAAKKPLGELFDSLPVDQDTSPLSPMTHKQRILTDFQRSSVTIGNHPMSFYREQLKVAGILSADAAKRQSHGKLIRVAGCVITRQRPGTAKGFVFLSLEDETGIVNIIVNPDLFAQTKEACVAAPYICVTGHVQNTWNVLSVKATNVEKLAYGHQTIPSHDFH